ncbi:MAG: hypothetical protein GF364_11500 [Candidatus Lokiarchaeota archaeon]|nr:hypothetical protein [Candidatus Lokiarchaeota archaeon]
MDEDKGHIINITNILEITWENEEGDIRPIDEQIMPYYKEIQERQNKIPLFTLDTTILKPTFSTKYVDSIKNEIKTFASSNTLNYAKLIQRLFILYKLEGAHKKAALIREILTPKALSIYEICNIIDKITDEELDNKGFPADKIANKIDKLMDDLIEYAETPLEMKILKRMKYLRKSLSINDDIDKKEWIENVIESKDSLVEVINKYFYAKLENYPRIMINVDELRKN